MSDRTKRRQRVFDLVFLVGIALKGLDGVGELLLGLPMLFLRPAQITSLAHLATARELNEDPHDLIAHLLLHGASALSADAALIAAVYLIIHGLVKVAIVIAMLRGSSRVYPWAIAALGAFLVWQCAEMILHPSAGVAALSIFDAIIIVLTWREWRQHRSLHDAFRSTFPSAVRRWRQFRTGRRTVATTRPTR
ncbi:DUF2127 domain-containing protein [Curtobacterium sp. ISL-83]|uniref:DUF2127 domain-containing protein n=1 Tax=Curtobacterium sp. ISL-83 TaxID=2819145 RepID=UPI001BE61157|nr:DUF2127 domain-containing protein [Curtobacterium sp. ISL-83]MBT2504090.1 DUF2127 domain-containing protein [Curtobacterium sp. ISL-83]